MRVHLLYATNHNSSVPECERINGDAGFHVFETSMRKCQLLKSCNHDDLDLNWKDSLLDDPEAPGT